MRFILGTLGACTALALSACASFPHQDRYTGLVKTVDVDDVVHCKYIGTLSSSSGLTGLFAPKGVDNIKNNLLHQADAQGATHVVWDKAMAGYDSTTLTGKAYLCPKAEK
jgi:hypothetical protein